jgi:hypothetical protein
VISTKTAPAAFNFYDINEFETDVSGHTETEGAARRAMDFFFPRNIIIKKKKGRTI